MPEPTYVAAFHPPSTLPLSRQSNPRAARQKPCEELSPSQRLFFGSPARDRCARTHAIARQHDRTRFASTKKSFPGTKPGRIRCHRGPWGFPSLFSRNKLFRNRQPCEVTQTMFRNVSHITLPAPCVGGAGKVKQLKFQSTVWVASRGWWKWDSIAGRRGAWPWRP